MDEGGNKEIKIVRVIKNKEAAKVFFRNRKERDEICNRRNILKEKYGMLMDEWLDMEERKKRFGRMDKVKELRRELKEKM